MIYDYIIVTHIPAFYKVNLYNELAKRLKILVLFIANNTNEKRADDFITLENAKFEYKVLFDGNFQERVVKDNIFKLRSILKTCEYKKIIVSGWDLKEFWYLIFVNSKSKNCLALESTINESQVAGLRGFIKKIFLSRISTVFASGKLHVELLNALNYKNHIKITKGVGIINKPSFKSIKREYTKRFLFIGRLSTEKNIKLLIEIFNTLPDYTLTIIGSGPQMSELKSIAMQNSIFLGQIENSKLKKYFLSNDIFVLPSISEPWGLVVEEALYFSMPVIVSENCGSYELIQDKKNGYILDMKDTANTIRCIESINVEKYNLLVQNISLDDKDILQVNTYLSKQKIDYNYLISIVTVVYNAEEYLEETIKSIINQTYKNIEYIIIDGGSTDGTVDIIKKYEDKIDYWISEKDNGIYDAMNKGIKATNGNWINFMNAGDSFYSNDTFKNIFLNNDLQNVDVLYGNHKVIYPKKTRIARAGNIEDLWKGSIFCHQSTFISSSVHKDHLYNYSNKIGADFEFFYSLYKQNKSFKYLDIIISNYSAGGLSDIKRIDSIVGWWNVIDKNMKRNFYYIYKIIKEILKSFIKRVLNV